MSDSKPIRIYPIGMSLGVLLALSFACGWYIAVIFVPAFNFFAKRTAT